MPKIPEKGEGGTRHTIKSLRLDIQAAQEGKTWLLLPEGFRDQTNGLTYPLPSRRPELQKVASIAFPPHMTRRDCGCKYIRRAVAAHKKRELKTMSAVYDTAQRAEQVQRAQTKYTWRLKNLKKEAKKALNDVRKEAALQIASLNDLFALGRKGIDGQMRAHLDGEAWKGEKVSNKDFRECFRMVTVAVKGLGLPSEQREVASETIIEEAAAALKSTREIMAMSEESESATKH